MLKFELCRHHSRNKLLVVKATEPDASYASCQLARVSGVVGKKIIQTHEGRYVVPLMTPSRDDVPLAIALELYSNEGLHLFKQHPKSGTTWPQLPYPIVVKASNSPTDPAELFLARYVLDGQVGNLPGKVKEVRQGDTLVQLLKEPTLTSETPTNMLDHVNQHLHSFRESLHPMRAESSDQRPDTTPDLSLHTVGSTFPAQQVDSLETLFDLGDIQLASLLMVMPTDAAPFFNKDLAASSQHVSSWCEQHWQGNVLGTVGASDAQQLMATASRYASLTLDKDKKEQAKHEANREAMFQVAKRLAKFSKSVGSPAVAKLLLQTLRQARSRPEFSDRFTPTQLSQQFRASQQRKLFSNRSKYPDYDFDQSQPHDLLDSLMSMGSKTQAVLHASSPQESSQQQPLMPPFGSHPHPPPAQQTTPPPLPIDPPRTPHHPPSFLQRAAQAVSHVASNLPSPFQPQSTHGLLHHHHLEARATYRLPKQTNRLVLLIDPLDALCPFILGVEIFQPGHVTPRHVHDHAYEMFFILSGRGVAWCDGKTQEVREGELVVFPPGSKHALDVGMDGEMYCVELMLPNEMFAEMVKSGEVVAQLDSQDMCVLANMGCGGYQAS